MKREYKNKYNIYRKGGYIFHNNFHILQVENMKNKIVTLE